MNNDLLLGLGVLAILAIILVVTVTKPGSKRDMGSIYTEGLDHLLRGNLQEAYRCFKAVISKDTDNISAYLKMGQTLREAKAYDKSLQIHESLLARPELSNYDRLDLYRNLALDYSATGAHAKAVEWSRAILKIEKRNLWALLHLVKSYRDLGDWTSCGKFLGQWQKATGQEDTLLQAYCSFRQGYDDRDTLNVKEVREFYHDSLKTDSKFAPAHYYLADSFADEARTMKSEIARDTSVGQKASSPDDDKRTVACTDCYSQAVAHWTAFVELSPRDTYRVLPGVEEALFYLQRFDDLELFLKQVLDRETQNKDALASLANFYVRKGELDRAEEVFGKIASDATPGALLQAIRIKLKYRRDSEINLMPDLDKLVDSIQIIASGRESGKTAESTLLNWLEPSGDPLEALS